VQASKRAVGPPLLGGIPSDQRRVEPGDVAEAAAVIRPDLNRKAGEGVGAEGVGEPAVGRDELLPPVVVQVGEPVEGIAPEVRLKLVAPARVAVPPGCCSSPAADRSARRSCSARSARSCASEATLSSPATPASPHSTPAPAKHQRHRLDRGGNRQLNCALHRIAITQGRVHPPARAYLERKQSEGKSRREAIRCLQRQLARTVYTTLKSEPLLT
jgi:hypothetical protein